MKLAGEIYDSCGSMEDVENILSDRYLVDESKVRLTVETLRYQRQIIGRPPEKSVSVYIGIPFCPTRCLYCSFTSNQVSDDEVERYLEALYREIDYCGENLRRRGLSIESMYIGGGTPTSLDEKPAGKAAGQDRSKLRSERDRRIYCGSRTARYFYGKKAEDHQRGGGWQDKHQSPDHEAGDP